MTNYKVVKYIDGEAVETILETSSLEKAERELAQCECESEHNGSFTYASYYIE